MPEWLLPSIQNGDALPLETVALRIGLSFVLGFVVAGVYSFCLPPRKNQTPTLATTLVLLSVLIALVTLVIGNSVARAFGLVGALSIVRFRTVVEDTRDTVFVIFAVVVGMASGAGYGLLAVFGIPAVALATLLMRKLTEPDAGSQAVVATLTVRVGLGHDADSLLAGVFSKYVEQSQLMAAATARQGAALELTYTVLMRQAHETISFVVDLNRLEGVQNVELRRQ